MMKTITTKMYYPCTYNLWKVIQKKDRVAIPEDFYLNMAEDLCDFYKEDFSEFLGSVNGQLLKKPEGIEYCYMEPWTNTINDMGDINFRFKRIKKSGETVYNKTRLWVARKKKCSIHYLEHPEGIYKKYLPYTDILKDKVYIIVVDAKTKNGEVVIPPKYADARMLLCHRFSKNSTVKYLPKKQKR